MPPAASHDLDHLLGEAPFVRSLARALAGSDADDVVQSSWVRALEHRGEAIHQARGWLACVVRGVANNLRRSQSRRRATENATARQDLAPSTTELMERQELRHEMLAAVDALPESQRTVVLLRHFEDLAPRQIASHLGVSVTTVTSRLRTAHANLRRRLDARYGGHRAWLLPILPLRRMHPLGGLGVFAMSALSKAAFAVAALVLAALALWSVRGPVSPAPLVPDGTLLPSSPVTTDHVAHVPEPAGPSRTSVVVAGPAERATRGTLTVHAVFGDDDTAVPDLLVKALGPGSEPRFDGLRVRTDAAGLARFDDLEPGLIHVSNARNPEAYARATVVAGEDVEVQLVLPAGVTTTGIVVDRFDVPVPGAEVCLAGLGAREDAEVMGTTGADGRFELRGCATGCYVAARAAGHCSSERQRVRMQEGSVRDLRLVLPAAGGTVVGTVRNSGNELIAGAIVAIGEASQERFDTTPENALRAIVRTDVDGRFRAIGLPVGEHPVHVRAHGLAPWIGACRVEASAETTCDVTLGAAVSCTGVVVDADGAPVAKATVEVGTWDAFDHLLTRSAANGSFRLAGLPPGAVTVHAKHEVCGTGRVEVTGIAGETIRCELQLAPGLTLRGQVLTEEGMPAASASVDARTDDPRQDPWGRFVVADAAGRFAIPQCPEGRTLTIIVSARGFRPAVREGVEPRRGDLVVRLLLAPAASVFITGTIVLADGRPVPQAELEASERTGGTTGTVAADDAGRFSIGPLRPGTWSVQIRMPDQPKIWTEWREINEGSTWDLGRIWLPMPGTIHVRLHDPEGLAPTLAVTDATLSHWTGFSGTGNERRSEPLAPGPHYVSLVGDGIATRLWPIEVRAGEVHSIDIEVQRGTAQEFAIVSPAPMTERHVRVLQNGKLVAGSSSTGRRPGQRDRGYRCNLVPGDYTITVTGNGMSGRSTFTVRDGGNGIVRVVLR